MGQPLYRELPLFFCTKLSCLPILKTERTQLFITFLKARQPLDNILKQVVSPIKEAILSDHIIYYYPDSVKARLYRPL